MRKKLFGTFKKVQKWIKINNTSHEKEEVEPDIKDVYDQMKSKGVYLHFFNDTEKKDSDSNS